MLKDRTTSTPNETADEDAATLTYARHDRDRARGADLDRGADEAEDVDHRGGGLLSRLLSPLRRVGWVRRLLLARRRRLPAALQPLPSIPGLPLGAQTPAPRPLPPGLAQGSEEALQALELDQLEVLIRFKLDPAQVDNLQVATALGRLSRGPLASATAVQAARSQRLQPPSVPDVLAGCGRPLDTEEQRLRRVLQLDGLSAACEVTAALPFVRAQLLRLVVNLRADIEGIPERWRSLAPLARAVLKHAPPEHKTPADILWRYLAEADQADADPWPQPTARSVGHA